jgi:hypothetical protein
MPRLGHGSVLKVDQFGVADAVLAERSRDIPLGFAVTTPADPTRFDYLFPRLQTKAANLLPEDPATVGHLVNLGRAMLDIASDNDQHSPIPAAYTYLGQFIDHDITLEAASASLSELLSPTMKPMSVQAIKVTLFNMRTATLDLDSVYRSACPARRAENEAREGFSYRGDKHPFKAAEGKNG